MNATLHGLALPGFADPVHDSQACFRAVLDAMARPGTLHRVTAPAQAPPPLDRATAAVLLTLVDLDTPLWLDPAAGGASGWIDFHCGAPRTTPENAAFAVALGLPDTAGLAAGSDDGPEDGATLVLQLAALGAGQRYMLSGPGIADEAEILIDGLPPGFLAAWATNRGRFPRGIDLILCAGDALAAFPRTLTVREG
ncbi:MAG: phosphonate C-P lyase system protein PhnH [Janthinobacterium lividum]